MRRVTFIPLGLSLLALCACRFWLPATAPNPDPNHTHADFLVFVNGEKLDFSAPELMAGSSADAASPLAEGPRKFLHLHDGNGHVIHRHKPGLTLKDFLDSLEVGFDERCYASFAPMADGQICGETPFRLFVNGSEMPFDMRYVFNDGDRILITNAATDAETKAQRGHITDEACLYSRTCPRRGAPPVEQCVADPAVPCVE